MHLRRMEPARDVSRAPHVDKYRRERRARARLRLRRSRDEAAEDRERPSGSEARMCRRRSGEAVGSGGRAEAAVREVLRSRARSPAARLQRCSRDSPNHGTSAWRPARGASDKSRFRGRPGRTCIQSSCVRRAGPCGTSRPQGCREERPGTRVRKQPARPYKSGAHPPGESSAGNRHISSHCIAEGRLQNADSIDSMLNVQC